MSLLIRLLLSATLLIVLIVVYARRPSCKIDVTDMVKIECNGSTLQRSVRTQGFTLDGFRDQDLAQLKCLVDLSAVQSLIRGRDIREGIIMISQGYGYAGVELQGFAYGNTIVMRGEQSPVEYKQIFFTHDSESKSLPMFTFLPREVVDEQGMNHIDIPAIFLSVK